MKRKTVLLRGLIAIMMSVSIFSIDSVTGCAQATKTESVAEIKISAGTGKSDNGKEKNAAGVEELAASTLANSSGVSYPQTNEIQAGVISFVGVSLLTFAILFLKKGGADEK